MDFLNNLFKCAPCSSKNRTKRSRAHIPHQPQHSKPKLSYKQGRILYEDKTTKVFSALCISTSASGIGVVVKRFKIAHPLTPQKIEACEKLIQLIEKIKRIEHPNLVRYIEASYDLDTQYFEIITEQLPISLEDNQINDEWHTKIYIMQILEAVEYLKNIGFTYLNLKLNNILFDHYGNLKIRDYIANHYIEFLMSSEDTYNDADDSNLDIEADIKEFMDIIRNIGMYKVKFKNASSYNGLIFYLENMKKWNFTRIRSDKFFSDIDQDVMHNSSVKGFAMTRTALDKRSNNPIFLTSEELKNVYKGKDKPPLEIKLHMDDGHFNGTEAFVKNLQRVQGIKKAKNVHFDDNDVKIENVEFLDLKIKNEPKTKAKNIEALRNMQKRLEDCFGDDDNDISSSIAHNKTQKIILNTIPSEYDDTPKLRRSPLPKQTNNDRNKTHRAINTDIKLKSAVFDENDSEILVQDLSDISFNNVKRSTHRSKEKCQRDDSIVDKSPDLTYLNQNRHLDDEDRKNKLIPPKSGNFKKKNDARVFNVENHNFINFNTSKRTDLDLKTDRSFDPHQQTFNSHISPERFNELRQNNESQHDILNVLKMLNDQKSQRFGSQYDIGSIFPSDVINYRGNSNEIKNNSTQYYLASRSKVQEGLSSGQNKVDMANGFDNVKIRDFDRGSWVMGENKNVDKNIGKGIGGKLNFNI